MRSEVLLVLLGCCPQPEHRLQHAKQGMGKGVSIDELVYGSASSCYNNTERSRCYYFHCTNPVTGALITWILHKQGHEEIKLTPALLEHPPSTWKGGLKGLRRTQKTGHGCLCLGDQTALRKDSFIISGEERKSLPEIKPDYNTI